MYYFYMYPLIVWCQFYVGDDGFRVEYGDYVGVSSENSAWNLIGFDEDSSQQSLLRLRRRINSSTVYADLPSVSDVVDDFSYDSASTRFSVAVQILPCKIHFTRSRHYRKWRPKPTFSKLSRNILRIFVTLGKV